MVQDPLGGHRIPSEAEFSIRGRVSPFERRPEGPYGSQSGYYSLQHDFPVMHVQRMWHRKDAIFPATITGKPRQEDYYLKDYLQRLLAPAYPLMMPSVKALWAYSESGSNALASAVMRESYPREGLASAFRILGEGQLSLTKFLLLTNEAVELTDFPKLLETVLERFNPASDLVIFANTSMDTLDYTGRKLNHGSKAVMMGTGNPVRELPRTYTEGHLPAITDAVPYCGGCLAVSGASYIEDPELPVRLAASFQEKGTAWPLIVLVDDAAEAVRTQTSFLWTVFSRFNPADDIYAETHVLRNAISYSLPIVIDARMKPGYPEELVPHEDTVELVNRNWNRYFPHF